MKEPYMAPEQFYYKFVSKADLNNILILECELTSFILLFSRFPPKHI